MGLQQELHRGAAHASELHMQTEEHLHSEQRLFGELRDAARLQPAQRSTVSPPAGTGPAPSGHLPVTVFHAYRGEMHAHVEELAEQREHYRVRAREMSYTLEQLNEDVQDQSTITERLQQEASLSASS